MNHPAAEPINRCWSCGDDFDDGAGFSIDDSGVEQVCSECWSRVLVRDRLLISVLFRRLDAGGLGIADLVEDSIARYAPFRGGPRN